MTCPQCGLLNPPGGECCDCGYHFESGVTIARGGAERSEAGWLASVAGGVAAGAAMFAAPFLLTSSRIRGVVSVVCGVLVFVGLSHWMHARMGPFGLGAVTGLVVLPIAMLLVPASETGKALGFLLAFIAVTFALVPLTAGFGASLWLRTRSTLGWMGPAMAAGGLALLTLSLAVSRTTTADVNSERRARISQQIEEIRRAELAYATARPGGGFTCNGPELPGYASREWQTDPQMLEAGVLDRSQLRVRDGLLYLRCDPGPGRRWVDVTLQEPNGDAARLRVER